VHGEIERISLPVEKVDIIISEWMVSWPKSNFTVSISLTDSAGVLLTIRGNAGFSSGSQG
jgi:hypothetical protein